MRNLKLMQVVPVLIGCVLVSSVQAETFTGFVDSVIDGDTVRVVDLNHKRHKVQLLGIDAPEKEQSYGKECRELLKDLVKGEKVDVIWGAMDQYGRLLATLVVDGGNVNLRMLADGCAWYYKENDQYLPPNIHTVYEMVEQQAIQDKMHLWQEENPLPPWEFRKQHY